MASSSQRTATATVTSSCPPRASARCTSAHAMVRASLPGGTPANRSEMSPRFRGVVPQAIGAHDEATARGGGHVAKGGLRRPVRVGILEWADAVGQGVGVGGVHGLFLGHLAGVDHHVHPGVVTRERQRRVRRAVPLRRSDQVGPAVADPGHVHPASRGQRRDKGGAG